MATESGRNNDGREAGKRPSTWLIVGAVAVVLVLAFWLFDAAGGNLLGDDVDSTPEEVTEDESPDVDFGEPADVEGPDIEPAS